MHCGNWWVGVGAAHWNNGITGLSLVSRRGFVHTTPGVSASQLLRIQLTSRHCLGKREKAVHSSLVRALVQSALVSLSCPGKYGCFFAPQTMSGSWDGRPGYFFFPSPKWPMDRYPVLIRFLFLQAVDADCCFSC